MENLKSKPAKCHIHVFVDCPYCGELQDLIDYDGNPRIDFNLIENERDTERTTDMDVECMDCRREFIVPGLEW